MAAWLAILLVVAAALVAAAAVVRAGRAEKRERRDLLADCVPLLDGGTLETDPAGYGVLRGRYEGVEVALRPFSEALAFRRLPQLWLVATVRTPTGVQGTIDVLRRPTGCEFYSPGLDLPRRIAVPPSWPQDTRVQASADAATPLDRLEQILAGPLTDDRTKEITLTPAGVRLVRQHRQGERGSYLIYRDGRFTDARVSQGEALLALSTALALARSVATPADEEDPKDGLVDAA